MLHKILDLELLLKKKKENLKLWPPWACVLTWPQAGTAKWQRLPLDGTQGIPALLHARPHRADTLYLSLTRLGCCSCSDHCPECPSLSHPQRAPPYPTLPSPLQLSWVSRVRGSHWPHSTALIQSHLPSLSCLITTRQKRRSKIFALWTMPRAEKTHWKSHPTHVSFPAEFLLWCFQICLGR